MATRIHRRAWALWGSALALIGPGPARAQDLRAGLTFGDARRYRLWLWGKNVRDRYY